MKFDRIWIAAAVFFFITGPFLFSGGRPETGSEEVSGESSKKSTNIEIQAAGLKGPTSIGMMRMFEEPPRGEENIDFSFSVVATPDDMVSKILSNEVDIASLPANLAANLYNRGVPYVMGGVTGFGNLYIVTTRDDVASLSDIRGKKIHNIAKGSTPDFMLQYLLRENGINSGEEVTIDFTFNHVEISPNIIAGKVDLALLPEPYVTIVLSKKPEAKVAVDLQEEWKKIHGGENSYPISCFVIKQELMEEHPEAVKIFIEAYKDSIDWVNENPREAGALTEKHMDMPGPVIAKAIPNLNLRFVNGDAAQPLVEPYLNVFLSFAPKSVGGVLPDENFYGGK